MSSERRSLLAEIERELTAAGHGVALPVVRRVARSFVGERCRVHYRDVVFPDELALALRLLDNGMSRPEARDALMVRLEASRAKAYRLLHAALDARGRRVLPPTHTDAAGLSVLAQALVDDEQP